MNIKYYEICERFALKLKGIEADSFISSSWNTYERMDFHPHAIFAAIGKGGVVMPIVKADFFETDNNDMIFTVIVRVSHVKKIITLFNPIQQEENDYSLEQFVEKWTEDGGNCVTALQADKYTYYPQLDDLDLIQLDDEMIKLADLMASKLHDAWAIERESEGWTWGKQRDDNRLLSPDIIPYNQLPDTEKRYDYIMAETTIKQLIALGYKIEKQ